MAKSATPASGNDEPAAPSSLEDLFAGALGEDNTFDPGEVEVEEEQDAEEQGTEDITEDEDVSSDEDTDDSDAEQEQDEEQDDELLDDEGGAEPKPETDEDIDQKLVTVNPDGHEEKVTVAEARQGYMRTRDYTKKTMAVAEEKKETLAAREQYKARLAEMDAFLSDVVLTPANKPDEALRTSDPGEYAAQMQEWMLLEGKRKETQAERERLAQEDAQRAFEAQAQFREQQYGKVLESLPHWKDEKVRAREVRIITEEARKMGFTDEDLGNLNYAPAIIALRKAALYDRQKAKAKALPRPAPSKGTLKPGAVKSTPNPKRASTFKKAAQRLRKEGSVDAFAALIESSGELNDLKN